jgi:hypothetical protein
MPITVVFPDWKLGHSMLGLGIVGAGPLTVGPASALRESDEPVSPEAPASAPFGSWSMPSLSSPAQAKRNIDSALAQAPIAKRMGISKLKPRTDRKRDACSSYSARVELEDGRVVERSAAEGYANLSRGCAAERNTQ